MANSKYTCAELIELVREKDQTLNGNRGCSVFKIVLIYLEQNDLEGAQYKCELDHDKLRQYEIEPWLREVGLFSEAYCARLDRWEAHFAKLRAEREERDRLEQEDQQDPSKEKDK